MSSLSLSDIKAFHADLLSIRSAGVPLRWGSGKTKPVGSGRRRGADLPVAELGTALSAIEMRLAAASLDGRKLTETLEHDIELPPQYLPTLRTWHRERRSPNAFEGWARGSLGGVRRDWGLRISLVQPLVWLAVGYLGLIFIVFAVAPLFLALHEQLSIPPGFALTVLLGVRAAFSVWGWLIDRNCSRSLHLFLGRLGPTSCPPRIKPSHADEPLIEVRR